MHLADDDFGVVARKDFVKETRRGFFGKSAVFAAFHVEAFHFKFVDVLAVYLDHVDCGILLLGVQEESAKDVVDVNLQEPISFVDGAFEVVANFERFLDVVGIGVDHDRVGVSVDDLELGAFREIFCATEDLAALEGGEHR